MAYLISAKELYKHIRDAAQQNTAKSSTNITEIIGETNN
jgi:hypothetical protein